MREIFNMWNNTKMIVLTALTAGVYGAVLGPFKVAVLIPGITEIRPGAVVPIVFGILFGPAGAWGSGIGNVIGDFFGTLGPGSFFGFFGNFFFAFCAYKVWNNLFNGYRFSWSESRKLHWKYAFIITLAYIALTTILILSFNYQLINMSKLTFIHLNSLIFPVYIGSFIYLWGFIGYYLVTVLIASSACAFIIAWGVELLGLYPFAFLAPIITLNNSLMAMVLGPILLMIMYPRVESWGLLWIEIMDQENNQGSFKSKLATMFIVISVTMGLVVGILISAGVYDFNPFQFAEGTGGNLVVLGLLPFLLLFLLGIILV